MNFLGYIQGAQPVRSGVRAIDNPVSSRVTPIDNPVRSRVSAINNPVSSGVTVIDSSVRFNPEGSSARLSGVVTQPMCTTGTVQGVSFWRDTVPSRLLCLSFNPPSLISSFKHKVHYVTPAS